MMDTNV